jgi:hypothetical protein
MYQFSPWKIATEGKGKKAIFILLSEDSKVNYSTLQLIIPLGFGFAFRSKLAAATLMLIAMQFF